MKRRATVCALTLMPLSAQAADADAPALVQEVVVTAQKRQEALKDVPISISVMSGETLDKASFVSVAEALNTVPGVVVSESPQSGGNMVAIRGVTASGPLFNGSSPVGYYLDSVPFGFITISAAPDASAFDLQRVEVLRGPQGTLYGASGEGGVVRVLTHDADLTAFDFKTRATLSSTDGGSGVNYRGDVMVNAPIVDGKLAVRAVVGYEETSGWINRPEAGLKDSNEGLLRNYRLRIDAEPVEDLTLGLSAWSTRNFYGGRSTSLVDRTAPGTGTAVEPRTWNYDAYGARVGYRFAHFDLSSLTSHLGLDNDYQGDITPFGAPGRVVVGFNDATVTSEEITATSRDLGPWQWTLGGFYRKAKEHIHQIIPGLPGTFADTVNHSDSAAVFGELGRKILDGTLEWTLGLRYFTDDVDTLQMQPTGQFFPLQTGSFSSTTPRAVLTWHPGNDVTLYTSYSEGFRSGFPQRPAFSSLPAVRPDKLHDYEVGAKGILAGGKISFDVAAFYYDWQDVQQVLSVPYQFTYAPVPVNGPSASGPGFELSLTTHPFDRLELGATFSWNDLTFDRDQFAGSILQFSKGDRLNYSSRYTGGPWVNFSLPFGASLKGKFSASALYSSKQEARISLGPVAPIIIEGNNLLFMRSSFTISDNADRLSAMLFVDNASNEYGAYVGNAPIPAYAPRPRPRTVGLQVSYAFE